MSFSPIAAWKKDVALNTYIFGLFLIGLPFTLFGTYVIYQLQVVGYLIGTDSDGLPCVDYCLVPFGNQRLDLNSVLLYLNAMGFGLGGAMSLLISAYADFWKRKSLLVAILIVLYGAVAIPVYWLRDYTPVAFNTLMALYVVYAVITYVITVVFNMFIPHLMRSSEQKDPFAVSSFQQTSSDDTKTGNSEVNTLEDGTLETPKPSTSRKYGFKMSIWGGVGTIVAGIIALVIVIVLSQTLSGTGGQTAGLLLTTVSGFITVPGAIIAYIGLPALPKCHKDWKAWWLELLTPLKDLFKRKNMAVLLLSYTIYTDTVFALATVTSQLYFAEVKPDTLEYSLYSTTGNIFQLVCTVGFYYWQIWKPPFRLEYWLVIGYALVLIVPIWGCIGLSDKINFGYKNRWEFYVQNLIFYLSNSIVNPTFRVLFAELVPKGSEIEWFGLQVILSCATSWVSYIANAPLQNATHNLRFPLVLCLIFLMIPAALEIIRCRMKYFTKDKVRWEENDSSRSESYDRRSGS